jgi:general secretion pathway protein G
MVADGGALATALKLYRMNVGTYPETLRALVEPPEDEQEAAKWHGPYIRNMDNVKDPWQNELNYRFPGEVNENGYDLWSNGPDGKEGTDDDIGKWKKEE